MRKLYVWLSLGLVGGVLMLATPTHASPLTDSQIRQLLIQESQANYSGNCPCPYNLTRNGSACGGRSAYSRAGGAKPLCYERDVPQRLVERRRKQLEQ